MYSVSQNAALVLVCSLVVLALQFSLHQERAHVGASHRRFWSLAGGIPGTLAARDKHAMASGHVSHRAGVLVLASKGIISAYSSPCSQGLRVVSRKKVDTIEKCRWKSHVAHPVRLTYLDLRLVHVFGLAEC